MHRDDLPDLSAVTTVDLNGLAAKDSGEISKLIKAAESPGYFYLDFRSAPATKSIVEQAEAVYQATDRYFSQPTGLKEKDEHKGQPASSDRGYKSCETDESFEMSTDEMRDGSLSMPDAMASQAAIINRFHADCYDATRIVLNQLAEALKLPFLQHHLPDQSSESGLKLIAEPSVPLAADVIENKHRDSGTLTVLFYDSWSMHICLADDENDDANWVFVPPPPAGVALVHGAKSLQRLSKGRLHAPLHRVTQPEDGAGKRYFLSYFLRPEDRLQDEWAQMDRHLPAPTAAAAAATAATA